MLNKRIPQMLSNAVLGLDFPLADNTLTEDSDDEVLLNTNSPVLPPDFYNLCSKTCSGSDQLVPEFWFLQRGLQKSHYF